jgi:large-conductance mechanosensitive channel
MQINGTVLAIVAIILLALMVFMVVRNKKDRKKLEHQLNHDYKKPKNEEHTEDADDIKNT